MAIAFRSASAGVSQAGADTIVVNKPAGVAVDDVIYVFIYWFAVLNHPTLAGWTEIAHVDDGSANSLTVMRRVVTGSEGSTFTFTGSGSQLTGAVAVAYSGLDTGTPEDVANTETSSSGANVIAPTLTTFTDNAWWIATFATDGSQSGLAAPGAPMVQDVATFGGGGDFQRVDHKAISPAGPTGTATAVAGGSAGGWLTISLALRPAAGGAPAPSAGFFSSEPLPGPRIL